MFLLYGKRLKVIDFSTNRENKTAKIKVSTFDFTRFISFFIVFFAIRESFGCGNALTNGVQGNDLLEIRCLDISLSLNPNILSALVYRCLPHPFPPRIDTTSRQEQVQAVPIPFSSLLQVRFPYLL